MRAVQARTETLLEVIDEDRPGRCIPLIAADIWDCLHMTANGIEVTKSDSLRGSIAWARDGAVD